jgi:hypothetical protein
MALGFYENHIWRLGSAIGIGCLITAGMISTSKIVQDKAEWYDWLVVGSCALSSCIASSIVLSARWQMPTSDPDAEWRIYHPESELSYMNWRGQMIVRSHGWYRGKDIQPTPSPQPASVSTTPMLDPLPNIVRVQPENCQDLAILDTQWAELCDRQAEWRYLYLLKQGIPPQEAFVCALSLANLPQ